MQFSDFLNTGRWTVRHRHCLLGRENVAALVSYLEAQLAPNMLNPQRLTVFCVFTPIEMLVAYLVASRLGLFAAIASPRTLPNLVEGLSRESIDRYVVHRQAQKYPALPGVRLAQLDFSPVNAAKARMSEPPACTTGAQFLFCSSGSTGTPKRIVHSEERLLANASMVSRYLNIEASDRTLCVFPINYMYGLSTTLCSLLTDGHIEYCEYVNPHLLAHQTVKTGATVLPIIGDWACHLAEAWSGCKPPTRRLILNASDRLLQRQAGALLPHASAFWNNFGQTEAGPRLFAVQLTRDNLDRMCDGEMIAPGYLADASIETRISSNIDALGFGTLSYRSPYSMIGTLSTSGTLLPAPEWIDSGDLFRLEPDGLHRWGGRVAHAIKHNGRFVSLRSIADNLLIHHSVTGVGFAKDLYGQLVFFLESETAEHQLEREISPIISSQFGGFQAKLCVLPKLPRTESGKIDTRKLEVIYNGAI